jgi:hypothetical protein
LVLVAIIAATTMRVVAVVGLSSLLLLSTPVGIQGITRVAVITEAFMHRVPGGFPTVTRRLVDGCGFAMVLGRLFPAARGLEDECVIVVSCRQRTLAGIASSRCRALRLLHHRVLEQCADLMLCLVSLGCRGLQEPSKQSHRHGYVLARPGEVWEFIVVLDDSPVRVVGTCAHLITVLCNLVLEHRTLLL